jgi:hypothetical protein
MMSDWVSERVSKHLKSWSCMQFLLTLDLHRQQQKGKLKISGYSFEFGIYKTFW